MSNTPSFKAIASICTESELLEIIETCDDSEVKAIYVAEMSRRNARNREVAFWERRYQEKP